MKKVFSKEKYIKDLIALGFNEEKIKNVNNRSWVNKCEGLTIEEMKKMGYIVNEEWFVEVPDDEVSNYEDLKEENHQLKEQVEYLRRSVERKESTISEMEQERIPYTNEYVKHLEQQLQQKEDVINKAIHRIQLIQMDGEVTIRDLTELVNILKGVDKE